MGDFILEYNQHLEGAQHYQYENQNLSQNVRIADDLANMEGHLQDKGIGVQSAQTPFWSQVKELEQYCLNNIQKPTQVFNSNVSLDE